MHNQMFKNLPEPIIESDWKRLISPTYIASHHSGEIDNILKTDEGWKRKEIAAASSDKHLDIAWTPTHDNMLSYWIQSNEM